MSGNARIPRCPRCNGAGLLKVDEPECNGGRTYNPCDRCNGMGVLCWNLPPGGDNADGPRASDGAITGIDGPDPDYLREDRDARRALAKEYPDVE